MNITKKKTIGILLLIIIVLCCLLLLSSCNSEPESFTVTFDANGGTDIDSVTTSFMSYKPIPSKLDNSFIDWYYDKECTKGPVVFPFSVTNDITLYAKWKEGVFEYEYNKSTDSYSLTDINNCPLNKDIVVPSIATVDGITKNVTDINFKPLNYLEYNWMESLTIGANIETITNLSIMGCNNLTKIDIKTPISKETKLSISLCDKLSEIKIENATAIPDNFINNCYTIQSISIPSSVTVIGNAAFASCTGLKNILFESDSVLKSINANAFSFCLSLENIELPNSLTKLETGIFSNCIGLKSVKFNSDIVLNITPKTFENTDKALTVSVKASLLSEYNSKYNDLKINFIGF